MDQARESGWASDVLEKTVRLVLLLEQLDRHPFLAGKLLLKGGTALNIFHLDLPRLSVDIDVNWVGTTDREELTAQRPEIERAVAAIAQSEGYGVATSADAHAGRKFYLQYTNCAGTRDRLEVDVNFLFRLPLFPPERRLAKPIMPGLEVWSHLVSWPELVAGKCVAAVDRVAPRDVFDLAQIHPRMDWADSRIRAAWIGLSAVLPHPLFTYDNHRFDPVGQRQMDVALRPFLRKAPADTLDTIRPAADSVLSWLVTLNPNERRFIDGIAEGHIQPELILQDDTVFCDKLRRHPALIWKTTHVMKHLRKR